MEHLIYSIDDMDAAKEFWMDRLSSIGETFSYPNDFINNKIAEFDEVKLNISSSTGDSIWEVSKQNEILLNAFLIASVKCFFYRMTASTNVPIVSPVYNKYANYNINKVVLLMDSVEEVSFRDLLKLTLRELKEAYKYQYYPLQKLMADEGKESALKIAVVLDNIHDIEETKDLLFNAENNFLFRFKLDEGSIEGILHYNSCLFHKEHIILLAKRFSKVLERLCRTPDNFISEIDIFLEGEQDEIINQNSCNSKEYNSESIIERFIHISKKYGDKKALIKGEKSISYSELKNGSVYICNSIKDACCNSKNTIIGVFVEKSMEQVAAVFGTLLAGGAYLPIDISMPKERVESIVKDSGTKVILTNKKNIETLRKCLENGPCEVLLITIDGCFGRGEFEYDVEDISPDSLAYIIYTSGSTGSPKGVSVTHSNIMNTILYTSYLDINENDTILSISNYSFDAACIDYFGGLLNGSTLLIISKEDAVNMKKLSNTLVSCNITFTFLTTAMFNMLVDIYPESIKDLRKIAFGGENASVVHVKKALSIVGPGRLVNIYGPTETTVYVTAYTIERFSNRQFNVPIGKPATNHKVWILDQSGNILPKGAVGQIAVGGMGVSKGYLNNTVLSFEKFTDSLNQKLGRIYLTGDYGRLNHEGNIEFLGRKDNQIKLRGFRIETVEIESCLKSYDSIRDAYVLCHKDQDQLGQLAAYIVSNDNIKLSELRVFLKNRIPEYMIPKHYIILESMPLNQNGKIDVSKLPNPIKYSLKDEKANKPETQLEEKIASIIKDILNIKVVPANVGFIDMGGHSLSATQLVTRIQRDLEADIDYSMILANATVSEIAIYIKNNENVKYEPLPKAEEMDFYPVLSAQKRLYFISRFKEASTSYNMPFAVLIEGIFNFEWLNVVIQKLAIKHEVLRTYFDIENGQVVQKVLKNVTIKLEYDDLECEDADEETVKLKLAQFIRPFDLSSAPLVRTKLLRLKSDKHVLIWDMHHIIGDGVSINILVDDFFSMFFGKYSLKKEITYKDYCVFMDSKKNREKSEKSLEYWKKHLGNDIPKIDLPYDFKRPEVQKFKGDRLSIELDEQTSQKIKQLCGEKKITPFVMYFAAYNVFLSKYSATEEIVSGTPTAGRVHNDLESIVGMFVNTLAFRMNPSGNKTFSFFLNEVRQLVSKSFEHQEVRLEDLLEALELERDASRNPIFDTVFSYNGERKKEYSLQGYRIIPLEFEYNVSKFDLFVEVYEEEENTKVCFEYSTSLFKKETIYNMAQGFKNIIKQLCKDIDINISDISVLDKQNFNKIIYEFNKSEMFYKKNENIVSMFKKIANENADNIALSYGNVKMSYKELNDKSDKIALSLIKKGLSGGSVVGILIHRSIEYIISILAVLKVGAAFVPLDVNAPSQRIELIMEESEAMFAITDKFSENIHKPIINLKDLDEELKGAVCQELDPSDICYIMYTSGSTGKPKGVVIRHGSVINFCTFVKEYFNFDKYKNTSCISHPTFDASIHEIFGSLLAGCTLHIASNEEVLDKKEFFKYINRNLIESILIVPSLIRELLIDIDKPDSLQMILSAGEKLDEKLKDMLILKGYKVFNCYGPTETTVAAIIGQCKEGKVVLGKPIGNTKIYILDNYMNPVPIGVCGQIYISGPGVSSGYINDENKTRSRFFDDPFTQGKRMYNTGDIGRWLSDGSVEYIGRSDHQVKINGCRIELEEIESAIKESPSIMNAAVTVREINGSDSIVAFVEADESMDSTKVREHAALYLPQYMIPKKILFCERLPLSTSGKIDRRKLAQSTGSLREGSIKEELSYVEEVIIEVLKDALNISEISIEDNFFSFGGSSISILKILSDKRMQHFNLSVEDFYKHQTIREISKTAEMKMSSDVIMDRSKLFEISSMPVVWNEDIQLSKEKEIINSVLLTGVTGFLGAHLIKEILFRTDSKVYCIVRGKDENDSSLRLNETLKYYFGEEFTESNKNRIITVYGDISQKNMGINTLKYEELLKDVDTVFHSAAALRMEGDYRFFENTNIIGTKNIIKFCQESGKRLHYMSTVSVAGSDGGGVVKDSPFNENDLYIGQKIDDHLYVKTKFEAEYLVANAMNQGLKATVYRVGNLTERYKDGKFQKNPWDNRFHTQIHSFVALKAVPESLFGHELEYTPVDCAAKAILTIALSKDSRFKAFHISNKNTLSIEKAIKILDELGLKVKVMGDKDFESYVASIEKAMGVRTNGKSHKYESIKWNTVDISRTESFLMKLGFKWPIIDKNYLEKFELNIRQNQIRQNQKNN